MNTLRLTAFWAWFCLAVAALSGCESAFDFTGWANTVDPLKKGALANLPAPGSRATLTRQQQLAFKAYFSSLAVMAYSLKEEPSKAASFDGAFVLADPREACGKTLIRRQEWRAFEEACTRNGFFLCAEEVRAYPEIVASLRSRLHDRALAKFDGEPLCKDAI